MFNRIVKIAMLNIPAYEEIEHDASLNREALYVVILVSALAAVGNLLAPLFTDLPFWTGIAGALWTVIWGVLGYYVFSYLTQWIGTKFFDGQAEVGEVLRLLGYAQGPRLLGVFSFIPCIGGLISLAGAVWSLVCSIVAIREALDVDTAKAVITGLIGWIVILIVSVIVNGIIGVGSVIGLGILG